MNANKSKTSGKDADGGTRPERRRDISFYTSGFRIPTAEYFRQLMNGRERIVGSIQHTIFKLPTESEIDTIAKDYSLEHGQIVALREAVSSITAFGGQICDYEAKSLPYSEVLKRVRQFEKALSSLRKVVEDNWDVMDGIVPPDVWQFLFRSFTFTAISKATGVNKFPGDEHLARVIDKQLREGRLTVQALEADIRRRHGSSVEYGHFLFRAAVSNLHESFRDWAEELERHKRRGGPKPDWFRKLVLDQLIDASKAIIGKRATSTHDGKFVELCDAVLRAFGQRIVGTRQAIAVILKERK